MLDIKFLRENPDVVKQNIKNKFQDSKLPLVDEVIELDKRNREIKGEVEALRAEKNKISKMIGTLMKEGKREEAEEVKKQVTANAETVDRLSAEEKEVEEKIKKIMMTLTMVAFMFGLANIGSVKVQAASPSIDKSVTYNLYKGQVRFGSVWVRNPVTNAKITGLKNSNSKVIEVTASEDDMYPHVEIKLVGEGTTKISFQYAGKTLTQKITVRKYKNPCKLLKIGKTNYAKCFNKSGHYNHNKRTKNVTGKITIKPKKGWKLKKIEVFNIYDGVKKVKNNSKVTLSIKGTGTGLYAYFKNAKTGVVQRLELGYGRGGFKTGENIYD